MARVKVFVSSVIGGYEHFRSAASSAIDTLGHTLLRSEDFPASAETAQQACLSAVRESDIVVLLLGRRYGAPQASGLSATHEEYREARDQKPVLVLIEANVTAESQQDAFIHEVQEWASGHVAAAFSTPEDLKSKVVRSLHDHELAKSTGPVDESEMLERARALIPEQRGSASLASLIIAVVGGPHQQVLRPIELEDPDLARDLQREALFGDLAILEPSEGTEVTIEEDNLVLAQSQNSIAVDQSGSICIQQMAQEITRRGGLEIPAIIEEVIAEKLTLGIRFSGWVLDRIDPLHRLTDVVILSHLSGSSFMPWRTRTEHAASPNSGQVGFGRADTTVELTPPTRHRQALIHDVDRLTQDLTALLRRAGTQ